MIRYAAFLRGIGPSNPNMHQSKLCGVLAELGFQSPQGVISSGNVVFGTDRTDISAMEAEMEAAWQDKLGFTSLTIIKSQKQLGNLIKADSFAGLEHGPGSYLMVTFFKHPTKIGFKLPHQPPGKPYKLLAAVDNTLFTTTDNTVIKTTDLMGWLERQYGKDMTSRTWLSVQRVLRKME